MTLHIHKNKTRFDTAEYLRHTPRSQAKQAVLERGEILSMLYFVSRSENVRGTITIALTTENNHTISVVLNYIDDCLYIDKIDYQDTLLKEPIVRRIVWLILSEAKDRGAARITGVVYSKARVTLLTQLFSRYGFIAYYKKPHYHYEFRLKEH